MEIFGFTLSAADLWLLGICGALIMALIGYRLALNVQKHNAFINAAALSEAKFSNLKDCIPLLIIGMKVCFQDLVNPFLKSNLPPPNSNF